MRENSDKALGAFRDSPTDWTTGEGEKGLREIADIFGIRLLQYETGPANGGGDATNVANRIRANRHFRMKGLIEYDLGNNWIDHPELQGGLAMYFVLSGSYNRYGCWGATEDMDELHTYKLQALYNLNGTVEDTQGPTFPSNITTTTDGNDIIVKWEAASDDNRVSHYRIIDDDGALATVPSDSLSVRLQDYDQSKISQLQVIAFDAFNNESGDSIITGIPRPGVGTPADQLHLYPNPVSSQLTIITDFTPYDHADIIQVSGRWIKSIKITGSGPLYINVADLPEGMYILLLTGDKTISRVFIKQN